MRKTKRSHKTENNRWQKAVLKIGNKEGLHTRPAAAFVKAAQKFPATIRIARGKWRANGKSILGLLSLGAKKGTKITLSAKGPRAKEALQTLKQLIKKGLYE